MKKKTKENNMTFDCKTKLSKSSNDVNIIKKIRLPVFITIRTKIKNKK